MVLNALVKGLDLFHLAVGSNWWVLNGEETVISMLDIRSWWIPCGWMCIKPEARPVTEIAMNWRFVSPFYSTELMLRRICSMRINISHPLSGAMWLVLAKGTWVEVCRSFWSKVVQWTYTKLPSLPQKPGAFALKMLMSQGERNLDPWVREGVPRRATQPSTPMLNFIWVKWINK